MFTAQPIATDSASIEIGRRRSRPNTTDTNRRLIDHREQVYRVRERAKRCKIRRFQQQQRDSHTNSAAQCTASSGRLKPPAVHTKHEARKRPREQLKEKGGSRARKQFTFSVHVLAVFARGFDASRARCVTLDLLALCTREAPTQRMSEMSQHNETRRRKARATKRACRQREQRETHLGGIEAGSGQTHCLHHRLIAAQQAVSQRNRGVDATRSRALRRSSSKQRKGCTAHGHALTPCRP
jgi:hypothetical protein